MASEAPWDEAPDRVVDRVEEISTTALDVLATLALAAGVAVTLMTVAGLGPGLIAGALVVMGLSAWAQRRRNAPAPDPAPVSPAPLPGPTSPGVVHFAGGE